MSPRTTPGQPDAQADHRATKTEPIGLRERNKRTKERLIREAAKSLFVERGFEATTLRAIAERADVGFGTVFAYAQDKAGLLAMVYVEELKSLPALFPETARRAEPLDELIEGLSQLYAFWAKIPTLSRHVLQQMEFYSGNPHVESILARRRQAQQELAAWVARLQREERIAASADVDAAAATLFAIYTSSVKEWSTSTPSDVAGGLARLRQLMILPMKGLAAG